MALTYEDSGVSIEKGDSLVERIKPLARATRTPFVLDGLGGFAGLCSLPTDVKDPVLVSGTDGVGTKLKVAFSANKHDSVGQDLVAMCVNDIITTGARPLFFLDYFACGALDVGVAESVISGIAEGCKLAGCALLGGETAELPGMYAEGEYDLAGFAVGVASRSALLGPDRVEVGDKLIAIASSGLHSNGYSLARRVLITEMGSGLGQHIAELGRPLGEVLLEPTRIYASSAAALAARLGSDLHAMSHITGGGVVGNLPRVLAKGQIGAVRMTHEIPAVFRLIAENGPVGQAEMLRTFNMGIGLVCIVNASRAGDACETLREAGETAWEFGEVVAGESPESPARLRIEEA